VSDWPRDRLDYGYIGIRSKDLNEVRGKAKTGT